jgi:hypothetical protein
VSLHGVPQSSQRSGAGMTTALLLICAVAFIWISSRTLPELVASHFAASGNATGFLPRSLYLRLTLILVVLAPLGMNILASLSLRGANARINLPNRDYWLAPQRRFESVQFVRRQVARLGLMLIIFFCYVHWLVVRANTLTPPVLSSPWFITGLFAFMLSAVIWAVIFLRRFRADGNG